MRLVGVVAAAAAIVSMTGVAHAQKSGKDVFEACVFCHSLTPGDFSLQGPPLAGIGGRKAGSLPGYVFSDDMKDKGAKGLTWTDDNLDKYIKDPRAVAPDGSMEFLGVSNDADRKAVIDYIKSVPGQ